MDLTPSAILGSRTATTEGPGARGTRGDHARGARRAVEALLAAPGIPDDEFWDLVAAAAREWRECPCRTAEPGAVVAHNWNGRPRVPACRECANSPEDAARHEFHSQIGTPK